MLRSCRVLFFSALLSVLIECPGFCAAPSVGQRWEHTLISKKSYAQPYTEITLKVTFTGPDGESFTTHGFWEEGNIFKIRASFSAAGKWSWRTSCSDTSNKSLHNKRGKIKVAPYQRENVLYQRGILKVSADKRTLAHQDNTPFLWMGDTGWHTLRESNLEEWKGYIDNRAAKQFTVIQVHVASSRGTVPNAHGDMPFENNIPNNKFWMDLETKVDYANEKGIIIYIVGLGASGKGGYLAAMNTRPFAQYITGRLAGNFVIFSPSMDARYDKRNDELGIYLKEASDRHLISQHVGTHLAAAEAYHPKAYLDFTSLQSGHHGGNVEKAYNAARNWSSILWNKRPVKPVINTEGMYDGLGNDEGDHWRESDVRKIGWLSWLSGALGYTYGAGNNRNKIKDSKGGVWLFNKNTEDYDYWEKAIEWESARQMTHMKTFFQSIAWWELRPAPELIMNQSSDSLSAMALATNETRDLLVAYLPDNSFIELELRTVAKGLQAKWYNPLTGEYSTITEDTDYEGRKKFMCPGEGDWVLLLKPIKDE